VVLQKMVMQIFKSKGLSRDVPKLGLGNEQVSGFAKKVMQILNQWAFHETFPSYGLGTSNGALV